MPILSAQSVFKTYRLGRVDVPVLRGVNLDIQRAEWVAILGASGSGKSTLLHILGGLDRPDRAGRFRAQAQCPLCGYAAAVLRNDTCPACKADIAGRVQFEGGSLADMSDRELDRYRNTQVGFVFQFYHLLPELTVLDNVLIGSMIRHGLRGYIAARADARDHARRLLHSFGLGHRLDHRPAQLSGGERQRVAIARALINDPPLLLADEPTGNLDRKTGRAILDTMIANRAESGRTMVIVTHDVEVAQRADRIVHLEDGRIVSTPDLPPGVALAHATAP
jgi:lipoprotein-releasing system ATP-binding protein